MVILFITNIVKRGSRSLVVAYQQGVPEGTKESIGGYSQFIGLVPLFVHQHKIIRALNFKVKTTSKPALQPMQVLRRTQIGSSKSRSALFKRSVTQQTISGSNLCVQPTFFFLLIVIE